MPSTASRLLALAAAILLAAAPIAARAADTCGLLSTAEIATATGDPVLHTAPGPSNCIWSGKNSMIYLTSRDAAGWANGKANFQQYGKIQPVSGVGEDAFMLGDTKPSFHAKKGAHFIILRVNVKTFSEPQTQAALKSLAATALSKM